MRPFRTCTALVIVALLLAACSGGGSTTTADASSPNGSSGVSLEGADESTSDAITTTTAALEPADDTESTSTSEAPATTAPPLSEVVTFAGVGSDAIELDELSISPSVASITHGGDGRFRVRLLDGDGERVDRLAIGTGAYEGSVTVNFDGGDDFRFLEVVADGPWTVTLSPLDSVGDAKLPGAIIEASGDRVFAVDAEVATVALFRCDTCGRLILRAWPDPQAAGTILVDQGGAFDVRRVLPAGTTYLEVLTQDEDGLPSWTLAIE